MGLVFGWLRSVYPLFGRIPEPAIWIFDTLGLCMFIAIVGLTAGPSFISGLQTTGLSLVAVGLVSALLPHTVGILFRNRARPHLAVRAALRPTHCRDRHPRFPALPSTE